VIVRGTTQIAHLCHSADSIKPPAFTLQLTGNYYSARSLSVPDSEVIVYRSDVPASTATGSLGHRFEKHTSSSQSLCLIYAKSIAHGGELCQEGILNKMQGGIGWMAVQIVYNAAVFIPDGMKRRIRNMI